MTENIPDEFFKVITDFINDIKTTFPEFNPFIKKWWKTLEDFSSIENDEERNNEYNKVHNNNIKFLFKFCQKKYPPRFFDILYQNDNIFSPDSDVDTEFLPYIHFKSIWQADDITPKTRETIWKYLQIINVSILSSINDKDAFGDSAKLFEAIDETEFKAKLEETLSNMQELFGFVDNIDETEKCFGEDAEDGSGECVNENSENNENNDKQKTSNQSLPPNIPNAEELHGHILGMLDGKLGKLAKEIAEETSNDLNMDMDNVTDMKDVFNKLIKNPTKLMGLIKKVSDKLDSRIKSGEIKESELISEATDIMNKMKNVPGLGNIQSMLGKMGMSGLGGKSGKLNTSAMEAQLRKNLKTAQMKERMREKSENISKGTNNKKINNEQTDSYKQSLTDEQLISIFSTGEKVEKTPRVKKEELMNNSKPNVKPTAKNERKQKNKK